MQSCSFEAITQCHKAQGGRLRILLRVRVWNRARDTKNRNACRVHAMREAINGNQAPHLGLPRARRRVRRQTARLELLGGPTLNLPPELHRDRELRRSRLELRRSRLELRRSRLELRRHQRRLAFGLRRGGTGSGGFGRRGRLARGRFRRPRSRLGRGFLRRRTCSLLIEHAEPRLMREAISMQVGRQSACNHLVEHTEPRLMREAIVGPQSSSAHQSIIRPPRHLVEPRGAAPFPQRPLMREAISMQSPVPQRPRSQYAPPRLLATPRPVRSRPRRANE